MGLLNSPANATSIFQKHMHLDEEIGELDYIPNLLIFIDDIIIGSHKHETLEQHLMKVKKVLKRLHHIGVKIAPSKTSIAIDIENEGINILGFRLQNKKLTIPGKCKEKILNLELPVNLKQLQSLVGKLSFYRSIFPLSLQYNLNILYKKMYPFTMDLEGKTAFKNIMQILKESLCEVSLLNKASVNFLFTDSSNYCIGAVLLNVNFDQWLQKQPIKSFPFKHENDHFKNDKLEYLAISTNLLECIMKTVNVLNYKIIHNDLQAFLNEIYVFCQLSYDFKHFIDKTNSFESFQTSTFNIKWNEIDTQFVLNNTDIISYILVGLSRLLDAKVTICNTKGEKISIGNFKDEIVILMNNHEQEFYGLNIIKSKNFKKTVLRFSNDLFLKSSLKNEFIKMIKNNTYETNKDYIQIVGYFSKAISLGILDKLGISFLELLSIYESMVYFERYISNKITFILSDNNACTTILRQEKIIKKSTKLDRIACKIWGWFHSSEIYFIYLQENQQLSDFCSRLIKPIDSNFIIEKRDIYKDNYMTISPLNSPNKTYTTKDSKINQISDITIDQKNKENTEIFDELPYKDENKNLSEVLWTKYKDKTKNDSELLSLPNPGNFFINKFKRIFNTEKFITEQIKGLNSTKLHFDILPHTIKYIQNKIYLPTTLYLLYTCFLHHSLGHLGQEKLFRYLNTNYYLEKKNYAKLLIQQLTNNCLECLQCKPLTHKLESGSIYNIDIKNKNHTIYTDLLEFPTFELSQRKNKGDPAAILVIKDVYSAYITTYIIRNKTGVEIKNCLSNYFSIHDTCKYFVSDNAKCYKNKTLQKFFKELNIIEVNSTKLKAYVRGYIEQAVRSINMILRLYRNIDSTNINADVILAISNAMLNKVPFKNSKLSPFNIQFSSVEGLEGKILENNSFNTPDKNEIEQFYKKIEVPLRQLIQECHLNRVNKQQDKLSQINKNKIKNNIELGDYVIPKTHDQSYNKKYKPLFALELYKVTRSKDFTLILANLVSNQIIHKHITDVKRIDFKKLALFEIDSELTEAFSILSTDNIHDIFEIPNLNSNKSRIKIDTNIKDKEVELDQFDSINETYISNSIIGSKDLEKNIQNKLDFKEKNTLAKDNINERFLYNIEEEKENEIEEEKEYEI